MKRDFIKIPTGTYIENEVAYYVGVDHRVSVQKLDDGYLVVDDHFEAGVVLVGCSDWEDVINQANESCVELILVDYGEDD